MDNGTGCTELMAESNGALRMLRLEGPHQTTADIGSIHQGGYNTREVTAHPLIGDAQADLCLRGEKNQWLDILDKAQ